MMSSSAFGGGGGSGFFFYWRGETPRPFFPGLAFPFGSYSCFASFPFPFLFLSFGSSLGSSFPPFFLFFPSFLESSILSLLLSFTFPFSPFLGGSSFSIDLLFLSLAFFFPSLGGDAGGYYSFFPSCLVTKYFCLSCRSCSLLSQSICLSWGLTLTTCTLFFVGLLFLSVLSCLSLCVCLI